MVSGALPPPVVNAVALTVAVHASELPTIPVVVTVTGPTVALSRPAGAPVPRAALEGTLIDSPGVPEACAGPAGYPKYRIVKTVATTDDDNVPLRIRTSWTTLGRRGRLSPTSRLGRGKPGMQQ